MKQTLTAALKLLNPPLALKVWEWGELRRRMGRNVTAKPGRYRAETAPYQREPQEALTDPTVQVTVLYWAKRLGKTEIINNLHGSVIEQSPRNILHVMPTLDSAKKWSKQFFMPMVRSTPVLRSKIKDSRAKDANNTILSKEFPGGTISAIGANSPSGFRQVQAPVVTCDEIDAMENGPEGDPITLAFGRAENYPDSVQVVASTATIKATSRIHAWYEKSDKRMWFVPCGCGKWHVLAWANVKWPKAENGDHELDQAYYEAPCCGAKWDDYARTRAILSGEWRATAPFKGIRGYWLNGLNTTFPPKKGYKNKLHQFAAEFYDAYTSGEASRIAWKNTFLCEPHEEVAEKIDAAPLLERCEDYSPDALPPENVLVGVVMDVQGDRLEYEIVGVGESDETWGIEYGKFIGNPEQDAVWASAAQLLARKFKRTDGVELGVTFMAIDHRHKGSRVRNFVRRCGHPRVYPVYGSSGRQTLLVIPHHNKHYRMWLYSVNTDAAKDAIFARLKLTDHGPRFMHYPKKHGYEQQSNGYFDQLTAEEVRIDYKEGFPTRYYFKNPSRRNEALDLRVYFLAALDILRPNITAIAKRLVPVAPVEQPKPDYAEQPTEPKPDPQPLARPQRMPRPRGGFVSGWRRR